jgi:hypothetical protein
MQGLYWHPPWGSWASNLFLADTHPSDLNPPVKQEVVNAMPSVLAAGATAGAVSPELHPAPQDSTPLHCLARRAPSCQGTRPGVVTAHSGRNSGEFPAPRSRLGTRASPLHRRSEPREFAGHAGTELFVATTRCVPERRQVGPGHGRMNFGAGFSGASQRHRRRTPLWAVSLREPGIPALPRHLPRARSSRIFRALRRVALGAPGCFLFAVADT